MGNQFTAKSNESWESGMACLNDGRINSAANRLYYSVFQAIKGFAVSKGLWSMDDSEAVHAKAREVVSSNVKNGFRRNFGELHGLRLQADYMPEGVDGEDLKALLGTADEIRRHHIAKAD